MTNQERADQILAVEHDGDTFTILVEALRDIADILKSHKWDADTTDDIANVVWAMGFSDTTPEGCD